MKKIKILALVMIFAFAALGGAYATLWKDTITLNTTVNTGNVSLKWASPVVGDDYHAGSPLQLKDGEDSTSWGTNPNANDGPPAPGIRRNVGHIALASPYLLNDNRDLYVTIDNAYPDYQGEIEAWVVNDGTIPVVIQNITATTDTGAQLPSWLTYNLSIISEDQTYAQAQSVQTTPLLGQLLEASNANGSIHNTIDPDATWEPAPNQVKVKISIHVASTANMDNQNSTVVFKLAIDGVQWNGVNRGINHEINPPALIDLPDGIVARHD